MRSRLWIASALVLAPLAGCVVSLDAGPCGDAEIQAAFVPGVAATGAADPLEVELSLCDARAFYGKGSQVVLTLRQPLAPPEAVQTGVSLPPGVRLVSGDLSFAGEPPANPLRLRGVVRAVEPGDFVLRGWGEVVSWSRDGSRAAPSDVVGVRGDANEAETFDVDCYASDAPLCNPPEVLLSLDATATNPSNLTAWATSTGPISVRAMFHTGAQSPDTDRVFEWRLDPERSRYATTSVRLPEAWVNGERGGYYEATFYAYPDPARDFRIHQDSVYFQAVDGQIVVREDRPPDA